MNATRAARPLDQFRARATAAIGTQWSGAKECNDPMVIAPTASEAKRLVVLMLMSVFVVMMGLGPLLGRRRAELLEPTQPGIDPFS